MSDARLQELEKEARELIGTLHHVERLPLLFPPSYLSRRDLCSQLFF